MENAETPVEGFTLRHATMDDLTAVMKLINLRKIAEYGIPEMTEEIMSLEWRRPDFSLATDAWVALAPDGQVIAHIEIGHKQYVHIYSRADVHPTYRGRGIGTQLLQLAEERAYQLVSEAPAGARVVLGGEVSGVNVAGQQFLEKHGFALIRNFWRMGIKIEETPSPVQWPEGISVHTLAPGMERAVYEAYEEAFRDHWGFTAMSFEEWSHWAIKRERFDPSLWFLAMDGDEIAAFAICADEKDAGGKVYALGVRRPWRRKGIGMALLHYAFGKFYRCNIQDIYLGVDAQSLTGATRLYERAGMHITRQYKNYEKELRSGSN